jgi:hypothetical protein
MRQKRSAHAGGNGIRAIHIASAYLVKMHDRAVVLVHCRFVALGDVQLLFVREDFVVRAPEPVGRFIDPQQDKVVLRLELLRDSVVDKYYIESSSCEQ